MDSFEVIISPHALAQLNEYIDYIQYTLLNNQAADAVWKDALETADKLETMAGSLHYCSNPRLKKLGYKPMLFLHHSYVMLLRIDGKTAYVEAIYHQLQDYENSFEKEL